MATRPYSTGPFLKGINSLLDPSLIGDTEVQWSMNALNRGGCYQTRPGLSRFPAVWNDGVNVLQRLPYFALLPARGFTVFTPINQDPFMVVGIGNSIYVVKYPFTGVWTRINGIVTDDTDEPLSFETCIKGATTTSDGELQVIDPYPILIIQCGTSKAIAWDGTHAFTMDPSLNQTPIARYMKWVSNRLWLMDGNRIRVSDILNPLQFTEEDILAEGGFFTLPGAGTGFGLASDQKSLLAFTNNTTTAFQAGILDRGSWRTTSDFQKVLLPDIGCVAPNTIVNQYGILWWLSEGGLVRLDEALVTYRTAKVNYEDNNMARGKSNITPEMIGRACAGTFENFLMLSVPSGDTYNAHTWILDQAPSDATGQSSGVSWSTCLTGIRPTQWITTNINGQHRSFALSRDYAPTYLDTTQPEQYGLWEAFCGNRQDAGVNYLGLRLAKDITCEVETKFLGKSDDYKEFKYASLEFTEVSSNCHLDVYYASRHSGYKLILSKDIIATTDSITLDTEISDDVPAGSYLKQTRTIETPSDSAQLIDQDAGVESPDTRNKDQSFSILVRWTGQMSLGKITAYLDGDKDHPRDGGVLPSETTSRYVNQDGVSAILDTVHVPHYTHGGLSSQNVSSVSSRREEFKYSSLG